MKPRRPRASSVSDLITQRLSLYLRCLDELERKEVATISSHHLAELFHLSSAQIRKDLATFGEFGVRGVGYSVAELKNRLVRIMGLDRDLKVVILGAGNLGMALADYGGFNREGFRIVALFDVAPGKVGGACRNGAPILHVSELEKVVRRDGVQIAVLAVPADAAQSVAEAAVAAGVPALLNFAPARIRVSPAVTVRDVDLKIQLESLAFRLVSTRHAAGSRRRVRA